MYMPKLRQKQSARMQMVNFKGYNHQINIGDGEFYDCQNLSSDAYPYITVRKPRGTVKQLTKPNGMFAAQNKLGYVDGTEFWYADEKRGDVEDSKKQFVTIGDYILIFPDKKYYKVSDDEFGELESSWEQEVGVTVTMENDYLTENETGSTKDANVYVKISAAGIGKNFNLYDGVTIEGMTELEDLNKTAIIYKKEDDFILIIGTDIEKKTQERAIEETEPITIKRKIPDMDYVTENANRVWGCSSKNHEIYASKLGDPFNFNCYEDISTDSYSLTIGSDGDFTGCITHMGYVLFLKENMIHKLYGNKPTNFQLTNTTVRGVEKDSEQSLVIINETLFYKSKGAIELYEGSVPYSIAAPFGNIEYREAAGGCYKRKYYISMKDESGKWNLFVYDIERDIWHKEDDTHAIYFVEMSNMLYYIDADTNKIMQIVGKDEENIKWMAELRNDDGSSFRKKIIKKIEIKAEVEGLAHLYVRYEDEGLWEKVCTIMNKKRRVIDIPLIPKRHEMMAIRLEGQGPVVMYGISKEITEGSSL